jgi:hypothetical protein
MMLEELIAKIENVSKSEVKKAAPTDSRDIHHIIMESVPRGPYDKMVLGYLTSLCAENMYPGTFELDVNGLDYVGFELEKGIISVEVAGDNMGSCMRHGKINVKKVHKISKDQGAQIYIKGVRYKRGLVDWFMGR